MTVCRFKLARVKVVDPVIFLEPFPPSFKFVPEFFCPDVPGQGNTFNIRVMRLPTAIEVRLDRHKPKSLLIRVPCDQVAYRYLADGLFFDGCKHGSAPYTLRVRASVAKRVRLSVSQFFKRAVFGSPLPVFSLAYLGLASI